MTCTNSRQWRMPVPGFSALPLATKTVAPAVWHNLRWEIHANRTNLYFASKTARLTPASGKVPCLYLSPSERASFKELYGNTFSVERENGRTPYMEASAFVQRSFLQVSAPELLLADLTSGKAMDDIHLDLGTLYAADTEYPRMFAQAIFDHPTKVDGIFYESRHTKEHCAVIWCNRRPALVDVPFDHTGNLADRATLAGSGANIFEEQVRVVS